MAWIIASISDGPVLINDLGLMLHKGQMKDLDLIGRENAERSNDIKVLLNRNNIKTIKKDPYVPPGSIDPKIVKDLADVAIAAKAAVESQESVIQAMKKDAIEQREQTDALMSKMDAILGVVQKFAEERPKEMRTIKQAIENIKVERSEIAEKRAELPTSGMTDEEIKMQDKILSLRDKKLEKNYKNLGSSITKEVKDASVDDALKAMDELGI